MTFIPATRPQEERHRETASTRLSATPVLIKGSKYLNPRAGSRERALSPEVVRGTLRAADFSVVVTLGLAIALVWIGDTNVLADAIYLMATLSAGIATVIIFELLDLYSLKSISDYVRKAPMVIVGWLLATAALDAAVFFFKIGAEISRFWIAAWLLSTSAALLANRLLAGWYVRAAAKSGRLYQRAVIYGTGPLTAELIAQLEADNDTIIRIAGIFEDRDDARAPRSFLSYPLLGNLNDLVEMSRTTRLDLIIVSLPLAAEERLNKVARRLAVLPADIKMPAKATGLRFSPRTYSHVGSVAMIDLFDKPITDWGYISKWLFDKIVGTATLLLLAPVMAAVAIAIKLDSRGPILFRQQRHGFNNEMIDVLKFRSMYVELCDSKADKLVTQNDPRVTRVGRFIRKASLDELPQLLNVIRGDLSLVGPRPHALHAKAAGHRYDDVVDGYFARHKVKPGITGWAQINGWRGETDTEEKIKKRVEHDLFYIENWSVFFDLYILLKTPLSLLNTRNAY